jgi:hypothetical protein
MRVFFSTRNWMNAAIEEYNAKHGSQEPPEFPIGKVALYGPDDKTTTNVTVRLSRLS